MKYKVGLLTFSESRLRENVYLQRKPIQDRETEKFLHELRKDLDFYIPSCGEIRGKKDIAAAVREFEIEGVIAVILNVPIFVPPSLVAMAARLIPKQVIVMGNEAGDSFSQLGQLAASGAIDQAGVKASRIVGDIKNAGVKEELLRLLKVISVVNALKGSTFGCVGGRSLGICTGTADPAQWMKLFGVDIEHIDQYELVMCADEVSNDKVDMYKEWVKQHYGAVCYKEGRFDENRLEKMIKSYLAVKSLIQRYELDFIGIKCQPEMSNRYVLQCLNVQLLNDPYDAEGFKEPVVCSCEADHDGALTMHILKLISGGRPTALQDIFHIDGSSMVLANCGSMASYFSRLSGDPAENLKDVYLQPHGFGDAGGASTQFVCEADTFTYARLFRKNGVYNMAILKGETEKRPREALNEHSWYRPTSFVKISINISEFMEEYGSNHIHCVRGDFTAELVEFCKYMDIPYKIY